MLPPSADIDHTVAFTPFVGPLPSGDHVLPSHFATLLAGTGPADVNLPAAYTSVPMSAIAKPRPDRPLPWSKRVSQLASPTGDTSREPVSRTKRGLPFGAVSIRQPRASRLA